MKHWKKVSILYQFLTFPLRKRLEGCRKFERLCSLLSGVCGLSLQVRLFKAAVLNCRNKHPGCSGDGRGEVLVLFSHPTGGELCPGGAGWAVPGQQVRLCMPLGLFIFIVLVCWCKNWLQHVCGSMCLLYPPGTFGGLHRVIWIWSSWHVFLWCFIAFFWLCFFFPSNFPVCLYLPRKLWCLFLLLLLQWLILGRGCMCTVLWLELKHWQVS